MPTNEALLNELEEKLGVATPGPWLRFDTFGSIANGKSSIAGFEESDSTNWPCVADQVSKNDNDLIVSLVNAAPILLRLARAGEKTISYLEQTEDLPETGLKKNVKATIAQYKKDVEGE